MKPTRSALRANPGALLLPLLLWSCDSATEPSDVLPPMPEANADQVGLPSGYATLFRPFYVLDRPDVRQVRVVFANEVADRGTPFEHGSVLVMETYRARLDAQGVPVRNANGR